MKRRPAIPGFSLVEVCLALGILSFCLIAILGIFPVGLDAFRSSKEKMVHTEIIKAITLEYSGMRFDQLDQMEGRTYHFSEEGMPVSSSDAAAIYRVEISTVQTNTALPANGTNALSECRTQQIRIYQQHSPKARTYTFILANRGL